MNVESAIDSLAQNHTDLYSHLIDCTGLTPTEAAEFCRLVLKANEPPHNGLGVVDNSAGNKGLGGGGETGCGQA